MLEVYLAEVIARAEFERKRQELTQTHSALTHQLRQLEAQAQKHLDVAKLAAGIEDFCRRLQNTLEQLNFAQRRQLVELLVDRVIVTDDQVEIRYVIPTAPAGEQAPFCHLRKDYLDLKAQTVVIDELIGGESQVATEQENMRPSLRLAVGLNDDDDVEWLTECFV